MLNANKHRFGAIGEIKTICGHVRSIVMLGTLGIAIGTMFPLGQQHSLEVFAQVPANNGVETNLALPRAGDAELLRTSPGEPLVPTVASPLTFTDSREWPSAGVTPITFSIEPITPVTPYIPNASPVSPARDVPGAFASDPLTAFPLYDSKNDK
jgi:hypothetical protein